MSRSANLAAWAKTIDGEAPFVVNGSLTVTDLLVTTNNITFNTIAATSNTTSFGTAVTVASNGVVTISSNVVSIGTSASFASNGSVSYNGPASFNSNSHIKIPIGTTADRPTGSDGYIRYNTSNSAFEGYSSGSWNNFVTLADARKPALAFALIFGG